MAPTTAARASRFCVPPFASSCFAPTCKALDRGRRMVDPCFLGACHALGHLGRRRACQKSGEREEEEKKRNGVEREFRRRTRRNQKLVLSALAFGFRNGLPAPCSFSDPPPFLRKEKERSVGIPSTCTKQFYKREKRKKQDSCFLFL